MHELEETHYDLYWDIQAELDLDEQDLDEQEPVAWRKWDGYGFLLREYDNGGEPLFKSPQSVKLRSYAQAEEDLKRLEKRCPLRCDFSQAMKDLNREPLSEDAICEVLLKKEWKGFVGLVRIIEKMHGIGEGNE